MVSALANSWKFSVFNSKHTSFIENHLILYPGFTRVVARSLETFVAPCLWFGCIPLGKRL